MRRTTPVDDRLWRKVTEDTDSPRLEGTHCWGHELSGDNVYRYGTTRRCRACMRAYTRARYWREKGLAQ